MRDLLAMIRRVRVRYRVCFDRNLSLLRPRRFSEKLQWRKLFDRNPLYTILSDKLAVRGFIEARIGREHLVPLLWTGSPDEIPFSHLSYPCVLKSTHAGGHVQFLMSSDQPREAIIDTAKSWLLVDWGATADEPGYSGVPRRLMIEQLLTDDAGLAPDERRLFVFNGTVRCINTVFREDGAIRNGAFHRPDWTRLDWYFSRWVDKDFPRPKRLHDMIEVAEKLGRNIDHVRVDIFDCGDRFYVGEITLYSWSGLARFHSDSSDLELGSYWQLKHPAARALLALVR